MNPSQEHSSPLGSRATTHEIQHAHQTVDAIPYLRPLIDAMPGCSVVLNRHRQIVECNAKLMKLLCVEDERELLGRRLGEALNCVNSSATKYGCGTAETCTLCGAMASIVAALHGNWTMNECRLSCGTGSGEQAFDLSIDAAPFEFGSDNYALLAITDISHAKRREQLERIFFHDVLNHLGTLRGWASIFFELDEAQRATALARIQHISGNIIEEVQSQRDIVRAEQGEMTPVTSDLDVSTFLQDVQTDYRLHTVAAGKEIRVDCSDRTLSLETDPVLLRRVIGNLLKNALEATKRGGCVTLSAVFNEGSVEFCIHNDSSIPRDVQLQLFRRSFSTKGVGRGLGTYSAKLFTEQFLGGSVRFTSSPESGTNFYVIIPRA